MTTILHAIAVTTTVNPGFNPLFVLTSVLVVSAGLTAMRFKYRAKAGAGAERDSWRKQCGVKAQSRALVDTLIAGAVLSAVALFIEPPAVVPVLAMLVFACADFWIRYAVLLGREPSAAEQGP